MKTNVSPFDLVRMQPIRCSAFHQPPFMTFNDQFKTGLFDSRNQPISRLLTSIIGFACKTNKGVIVSEKLWEHQLQWPCDTSNLLGSSSRTNYLSPEKYMVQFSRVSVYPAYPSWSVVSQISYFTVWPYEDTINRLWALHQYLYTASLLIPGKGLLTEDFTLFQGRQN